MKLLNFDKNKDIIKPGLILILSAGIVALIVLLNFFYADKLQQIQVSSNQNAQRLTAIENFLNQQIQAAQQQQKTQTPSAPITTEQK